MSLSGSSQLSSLSMPPLPDLGSGEHHNHSVQFYQDDRFLLEELARFVGAALGAGDAGVVIATEPHRRALVEQLGALGLDVDLALRQGRYVPLDAAATLARCLTDNRPDYSRCAVVLGGIINRAVAHATTPQPRAALFGEMVALLWADGQYENALTLERIWNELIARHPIRVHCAYPMAGFSQADDASWFDAVCAAHTQVVPAESYRAQVGENERLRAVALLQQKAQALETEIDERRRAQAELRQRNQELRAAVAARDEFLSVAAHELKTPITTLRAYAQLLLRARARGHETPAQRLETALAAIEQQTGKLSQLVERLLDSAQVEAGKLRLDPTATDLVGLVRATVERQVESGKHRLIFRGPERLEALVDPLRFEQVIGNLVDNAIKFSPDGGTVTVELGREPDGQIRLAVTDEGIGVPLEAREEVFNRFHQAHDGRHLAGMGLGLYISREIVQSHGGWVRIEDPPHPGTRFVVSLPVALTARQPDAVPSG